MIGDAQFREIRQLPSAGHRLEKHFRVPEKWFSEAVRRVADLGLVHGGKRWILDVESRVPYFAAAAGIFGHDVLSIDRPDELVESAAAILGHDFFAHEPSAPLPELPHGFDLVTCWHGVRADSIKKAAPLIDSLIRRLNPGGRLLVAFAADWQGGRWQLISKWRRILRVKTRITKPDAWLQFELK